MGDVVVRKAVLSDMVACAAILNDWIDATDWMPRIHTRENVVDHYEKTVFPERSVYVAEKEDCIAGFMAIAENECITALYLDEEYRGVGCGRALLDEAKQLNPKQLELWTFVKNTGARRFYEREGFKEVRRTDGENEEGLTDILFRWKQTEAG